MRKRIIFGIISFIVLIFIINEFQIFGMKFWGTRLEDARRQKFENTQSYVESARIDLANYHHQWVIADSIDKLSIESVVRQRFANLDRTKITDPILYGFLTRIMEN